MDSYSYQVEKFGNQSTLNLFIHGLGSAKEEWFEMDEYTKGGNLTRQLVNQNQAILAVDLYGHGAWPADEQTFDAKNISDDDWPKFVKRSVMNTARIVNDRCRKHEYTQVNVFSYSGGAVIALKVINLLDACVNQVFLASPQPEREYDDEYSLHNNVRALLSCDVFIYCGLEDEYVEPEELEWCFDQIQCRCKKLHWYKAGHSLPSEWVEDALNDFTAFSPPTQVG